MNKRKTILVLDGEQRSALAAVRSLAKSGLRVIVGSEFRKSLSGHSTYCEKHFQYAQPYKESARFIADLVEIIKSENVNVLLPMTDISVYNVLSQENKFSRLATLPFGTFKQYLLASDKYNLVKTARELNVPAPYTIFIDKREEIEKYKEKLFFPLILKPRSSLIKFGNEIQKCGVHIIQNYNSLMKTIQDYNIFSEPFMIQEKLNGEGLGIFTLFNRGEPVAIFSHRRLREKPPWGGVSVLCETTEPDPEAKKSAMKLLKKLKWHGAAMVEFKRDHISGIPKLMEINARFWGSLQLAIDAGINFPYLLYLMSQKESLPYLSKYKYSRLRWLMGDFDNLYIKVKNKRKKPELFMNSPGISKSIINFILEFKNKSKLELLRLEDLSPFVFELKVYIYDIIKRFNL